MRAVAIRLVLRAAAAAQDGLLRERGTAARIAKCQGTGTLEGAVGRRSKRQRRGKAALHRRRLRELELARMRKADLLVAVVAERLVLRRAAAAQRHARVGEQRVVVMPED